MTNFQQDNAEIRQRAIEDEKLVRGALRDESAAFAALVERYMASVYAVGWSEFHERERAEELVQEVFLRAYLGLKGLQRPEFFPVWIHRIARNLASTWKRQGLQKSKLMQMVPLEESAVEIPDARNQSSRDRLATQEEDAKLREAVIRLPEDLRQVVLLHFSDELSLSEIGRRLGLAPSSVSRRLDRALMLLRADLGAGETADKTVQRAKGAFRPSRQFAARTLAGLGTVTLLSPEAKAAILEAAVKSNGGVTAGVSMHEVAEAAEAILGKIPSTGNAAIGSSKTAKWSLFSGSGKFLTAGVVTALLALVTGAVISNRKPLPQTNPIQETAQAVAKELPKRIHVSALKEENDTVARHLPVPASPSRKTNLAGATSPTSDPESVDLTVHVTWEGGGRIPGAEVRCSTLLDYASDNRTTETRESARNISTKLTDEKGNAIFSLPKQSARVRLDASCIDSIRTGREVTVEPGIPVVLTLKPGRRVSGTVYKEENGQRVTAAGATVMITSDGGSKATSGPDGKYTLSGLSGKEVEIIAKLGALRAPAKRDDHIRVKLADGNKNEAVDLVLQPTAILIGGVVDRETGNPIAGARVTAFAHLKGSNHLETYGSDQDQTTITDNLGMFSFEGLPSGSQKIKVLADGYGDAVKAVDLVSGETNNTLLALDKGGIILVNAIDRDGVPVEGATLNVMREGGWFLASRTDRNGQVALPGVDWDVEHTLWVWKHSSKSKVEEITLNRGEAKTSVTLAFNFRLAENEAPGVILGTVKDESGRPIQNASLYAQQAWAVDRDATGDRFLTNAEGEFRLERRGATGTYYISVAGKGWAPSWAKSTYGTINEPQRIDFVLKPGLRLKGKVIDNSSGAGIGDVTVRAYPLDADVFTHYGHPGLRETTTRSDGTFQMTDLPGPEVLLRSRKTGWVMMDPEGAIREVNQSVRLNMTPAGEVAGRIVDSAGNPVPDFIVKLADGPMFTHLVKEQQFFNEDGRFRLSDLIIGHTYELKVVRVTDNFSSGTMTVQAKEAGASEIAEELLILK